MLEVLLVAPDMYQLRMCPRPRSQPRSLQTHGTQRGIGHGEKAGQGHSMDKPARLPSDRVDDLGTVSGVGTVSADPEQAIGW